MKREDLVRKGFVRIEGVRVSQALLLSLERMAKKSTPDAPSP
jgi:hypothetical protein